MDFAPLNEYFSGCEGGELSLNEGKMPVVGDWGKLKGFKGDGFYRFAWKFTNRNSHNVCEICVDASVPLRLVSAKELVLSIRQSVKRSSSRDLDQLNRDDEIIQNELTNSDDKVFLYELLQNANDYPFPGLRNVSHIRQEMQTMAFHIKDVRHNYAHKKTKSIVDTDPATLQYHIDTLIRFRDGLCEVPKVKKASPTTVVTKNGLTISVS